MSKQYLQQVSYRGFMLGEWLHSPPEQTSRQVHRWDVIDAAGKVLQTFSDRAHAESYVDHHASR